MYNRITPKGIQRPAAARPPAAPVWKRPSWFALLALCVLASVQHGWLVGVVAYPVVLGGIVWSIRSIGVADSKAWMRSLRWLWLGTAGIGLAVWDGALPLRDVAEGALIVISTLVALTGLGYGSHLKDRVGERGHGELLMLVSSVGWFLALFAITSAFSNARPSDFEEDEVRCETLINPC